MINLIHTDNESNALADAFYKAIKECPFDKNKDVSGWADAKVLYEKVLSKFFTEIPEGSQIKHRRIFIEDPDLTICDDMNSYLVVELVLSQGCDKEQEVCVFYRFLVDY